MLRRPTLMHPRCILAAGLAGTTLLAGGVAVAAPGSGRVAHTARAGAVASPATPADVVALASSFAGVPYVWGGTTPRGFDCSGLVQYVYGQLGVRLPRVAQAQYDVSRRIAADQLRPGDLVFWGGSRSIHHVAIYAGAGKVWSAPHRGARVRLQAMWGGQRSYGRVLAQPTGPVRPPLPLFPAIPPTPAAEPAPAAPAEPTGPGQDSAGLAPPAQPAPDTGGYEEQPGPHRP